jgi:hypothetical protein
MQSKSDAMQVDDETNAAPPVSERSSALGDTVRPVAELYVVAPLLFEEATEVYVL